MEFRLDTLMVTTFDRLVRRTPGGGGTFRGTGPTFSIATAIRGVVRTVDDTFQSVVTFSDTHYTASIFTLDREVSWTGGHCTTFSVVTYTTTIITFELVLLAGLLNTFENGLSTLEVSTFHTRV